MLRKKLNTDWYVSKGSVSLMDLFLGGEDSLTKVNLPHDAMIAEKRDPKTKNGHQTGFYPGNYYTYLKRLDVPEEWEGLALTLEFEGVSGYARVYVNGEYAGGSLNSYSNFYVEIGQFLKYGTINEIKVEINNVEQSSRWYPGGGIYRGVNLIAGGAVRLQIDGLKVRTPEVEKDYARIEVKTVLLNTGMTNKNVEIYTVITNECGKAVASDRIPVTAFAGADYVSRQYMELEHPQLWDAEHPNLYTCHVQVVSEGELLDEEITEFGVRELKLTAKKGLRINGKEVKLRGACIHHDNGIIGAATLDWAEERRIRQLKEAGFNCIRSSHHPLGKAMLSACDRVGMYVIDELSDIWTRSKNQNDYSQFFTEHWEEDVKRMVDKDYNHPCVLIYCMGNEIQEAGTAGGAAMNRRINEKLKELDDSRFTTNAINGMVAASGRMGEIMAQAMGMSMEEMALAQKQAASQEVSTEGSDALNGMMSVMTGPVADAIATSPILAEMIEEFVSCMDIAGYNYLTALHEVEKERHPNRVVLGTETYPADIVHLWEIVQRNHHVIGDMTWAGYEYIGEAGCGIFHYDGTENFSCHWPDRLAYIGDINLAGYRRPVSYLREIVYGLRKEPYIAVKRMNKNGQKSSITPWMWKDSLASWTWPGYEGQEASVDVYTDGDEVELLLNDQSIGRKNVSADYEVTFSVPYEPGTLKAVSYREGKKTGSIQLTTAHSKVQLAAVTDRTSLSADGEDVAYVTITLEDEQGNQNLYEQKKVTILVEGAGMLAGMGNADPQALEGYQENTWPTYDGYLLSAIRSGTTEGKIVVTIEADGCETRKILLEAVKRG